MTNRALCTGTLEEQMEYLASSFQKPDMVILREKDLSMEEYRTLAIKIKNICERNDIKFVPHNFYQVAEELNCTSIHLPMSIMKRRLQGKEWTEKFTVIGSSVHSVEEAVEAYELGASYVTAGHIFDTDCKRGMPGRGIEFLQKVCEAVPIPVYAIGGIKERHKQILENAGAVGGCRMSDYMKRKE